MKHCVIIQLDTKDDASFLANSLLSRYMGLRQHEIADNEVVYYAMTDLCEDISGVIMLIKKEDEK